MKIMNFTPLSHGAKRTAMANKALRTAQLVTREVDLPQELSQCYEVLKELRSGLSLEDFHLVYSQAKERDQFTLVAIFRGRECIAVMGLRVLYDFIHGKHLYIDDLVVTETQRSKGLGKNLLGYAELLASQQACNGLRLCTGSAALSAQDFYQANGWESRAVVFKKGLK